MKLESLRQDTTSERLLIGLPKAINKLTGMKIGEYVKLKENYCEVKGLARIASVGW